MFKWFDKHKANRRQLRHKQGFDYAAGELLRNPTQQTLDQLQLHVDSAHHFHEFDEFDEGIVDAMKQYKTIVRRIRGNVKQ